MPIPSIIAGWYHDRERPLVGNGIDATSVRLWALAVIRRDRLENVRNYWKAERLLSGRRCLTLRFGTLRHWPELNANSASKA